MATALRVMRGMTVLSAQAAKSDLYLIKLHININQMLILSTFSFSCHLGRNAYTYI
jgi:hypothetical protein